MVVKSCAMAGSHLTAVPAALGALRPHCKLLETWDCSGDRENPPDSGWDCGSESEFEFIGEEEAGMEDKAVAAFYADRCTEWKYSAARNEEYSDYLEGLSPITNAVNVYYGSGSYTVGGCDTGEYPTADLKVVAVDEDTIVENNYEENCLIVGSKEACDAALDGAVAPSSSEGRLERSAFVQCLRDADQNP